MKEWVKLKADDRHQLKAYVAKPAKEPIGALVVVQEIFGVNKSIRRVVDEYAKAGYLAIAPALFDRIKPNVELGYSEAEVKEAFTGYYPLLSVDKSLLDIAAAFHYVKRAGKPTGVLGFCYGGLTAWLSATRGKDIHMEPDCCVGYYPGGIGKVAEEEPTCPVLLHFGKKDTHIGMDQVDAVRNAHRRMEIHLYDGAGHAFANPDRPSYDDDAADLAHYRTMTFLRTHLVGIRD
jgi:carboxymethylenebutenolidase